MVKYMAKETDLVFIGAGPSTIFAVLELIKLNYKGNILIIEKGKSLSKRQPKEVISGFAGAGCFSDSKLSSALDVGGYIPGLTQVALNLYDDEILKTLNHFNKNKYSQTLMWDNIQEYDTSKSTLKWNTHRTCHIGTERGQAIYYEIEKYLQSFPNISILFETEVVNVYQLSNLSYQIITKQQDALINIVAKKLVLATGQKSILSSKVVSDLNLKTKPRAFQLGIRVVDTMNKKYEEIIKANYDFKFEKEYRYDNLVKVRVRTFCCNSGNAYTCAENVQEGFVCFNGHAFKTPNPDNKSVNYGIMCEIFNLKEFDSKENQIELMKKVNSLDGWAEDNLKEEDGNMVPAPKSKLLKGFKKLEGTYPKEVILALEDFVKELNKLVPLKKAYYLYPEVKLSGFVPDLDYTTFQTKAPNLYMIGDCVCSRGIVKAAITGIMFADSLDATLGE